MRKVVIAAADAPPAIGGYAQALKVEGARSLVFVSGQVPVDAAGHTPPDFAGQCRLVWRNIEAQLRAAGLRLDDIVKVTTFLADEEAGAGVGRGVADGASARTRSNFPRKPSREKWPGFFSISRRILAGASFRATSARSPGCPEAKTTFQCIRCRTKPA